MRTGTLISSHGEIEFDVDTGDVIRKTAVDEEEGLDYLSEIVKVDVVEWLETYPGEDPEGPHDILDFGTWSYTKPQQVWREEYRTATGKE